jgi:16S rRNA (cytidine1402-2'-O)-methyltransferase
VDRDFHRIKYGTQHRAALPQNGEQVTDPQLPDDGEVRPGCLYVVATPIGNLGDLSPRAQRVLSAVTRIAAEDTRTTGVLLSHFGIRTPLLALHEHNEERQAVAVVEALRRGDAIALVSDAGTPLISDPGFDLVRAARAAGCEVIAVPGACAAIAALSISGLPSDSFLFAGFLPAKSGARRERIQQLAREPRSVIVYEASHRIADCAKDLAVLLPDRRLLLAREISKRFEQSVSCLASELPQWIEADANRTRGEFVLVIEGAPQAPDTASLDAETLLRVLLGELPAARAAKVAAALTGRRKRELYDLALRLAPDRRDPDAGRDTT